MLKKIPLVLISLSALPAFAGGNGPLLANGASGSYQILENAFNAAHAAQISDFPLSADIASANPSMKCVCSTDPSSTAVDVSTGQPDNLSPSWIGRIDDYVTTPAQPGAGPLFPGTPVTSTSVISFMISPTSGSSFAGYSNAQWAALFSDPTNGPQVTMSTTAAGDLQSATTLDNDGFDNRTDTFRKNGSLLFVHEVLTPTSGAAPAAGAPPTDVYAYCYPAADQN